MDPKEGKIMSCCLLYNGDLVPKDVGQKVILKLKKTLTWTDWTQTGFKCGIGYN
jgi:tubulin alpha